MSKFKIGDKVKCVKPSIYMNLDDGEIYEVLNVSKTTIQVNKKIDSDDWICDYRFILQEDKEEMKSESFNLKTNPWFIRVNNKEEFEAVGKWIKEKTGYSLRTFYFKEVVHLTNTDDDGAVLERLMYVHSSSIKDRKNINCHEIKLTFKTVVDSVEYPVLESEQQKKIRELKETIEKASAQIAEIEKEMK